MRDDLVADDGPSPITRFSTPAGSPAASIARMSSTAAIEVVGAGTQTIALPVASPGPRYSTGMFTG